MNRLQSALDFIGGIAAEPDVESMLRRLKAVVADFGFQSFVLTGVPDPGRRIDGYIMLSGWTDAWLERYLSQDYVKSDPVVPRLYNATTPFRWSEALEGRKLEAPALQVMDEAASIGMADGLCVPLLDLDGRRSVLSMAGDRVDLSPTEEGVLHLVAMYAQARMHEIIDAERPKPSRPVLSPREKECLQWTAAGKTSWEIAGILSLSQNTTDGYIASATRKLGAVNRTQAVAEAIRRGIIY